MQDDFYLRFEEHFRGSKETIKQRLAVYLPAIETIMALYPDKPALDIGCGRGEWLELLKEQGYHAKGVDLNTSMVAACQEMGFDVVHQDALAYLKQQEQQTFNVISGFHIAEHLPFEQLFELIQIAKEKLVPGGLLILETPNPESIQVGSCSFYLDPTHKHPLPPDLMEFIAKDLDYHKIVIKRLNGQQKPDQNTPLEQQVSWALTAYPDYSLIAQTEPIKAHQTLFDTLEQYQTQVFNQQRELDTILQAAKDELQAAKEEAHKWWLEAEKLRVENERLHTIEIQFNAMLQSTSWRITRPIRRFADHYKNYKEKQQKKKKNQSDDLAVSKKLARKIILIGLKSPFLKKIASSIVNYSPELRQKLVSIAFNIRSENTIHDTSLIKLNTSEQLISKRAQEIYTDLTNTRHFR